MKPTLWHSSEFINAVKGQLKGNQNWEASGISIDTRSIQKGNVFFALNGNKRDGHDFIENAFKGGAVAAVVEKSFINNTNNRNLILVKNTFNALNELSINRRKISKVKLIGITGSVGKTTTKDYLLSILKEEFLCFANKGNYNNKFGVPLSLSQIPKNAQIAIQEMGMSSSNEIKQLSLLSNPDIALITSIGSSHLENFRSIKEIALAKSEIFHGLKKDGVIILPGDSKHLEVLKSEANNLGFNNFLFFGTKTNNDCQILSVKIKYNITEVSINLMGKKLFFKIKSHQAHNAFNAAAAILTTKYLGLSHDKINKYLLNLNAIGRRGNIFYLNDPSGSKVTIVDDTYNSSFESTSSAILSLRNLTLSNPVLILGDMLELGKFSINEHKKLIPIIEEINPRLIIFIGKEMSNISKFLKNSINYICFESSQTAKDRVPKLVKNNDIILLKGSNGMELNLIKHEIIHYYKKLNKRASNYVV